MTRGGQPGVPDLGYIPVAARALQLGSPSRRAPREGSRFWFLEDRSGANLTRALCGRRRADPRRKAEAARLLGFGRGTRSSATQVYADQVIRKLDRELTSAPRPLSAQPKWITSTSSSTSRRPC